MNVFDGVKGMAWILWLDKQPQHLHAREDNNQKTSNEYGVTTC